MDTFHLTGSIILAVVGAVVVAEMSKFQIESSSVDPVGIAAYRSFHANDSLIGKPIPCTREEKICFQYNGLFIPEHSVCLPDTRVHCVHAGNRNEFFNKSGHLFATCPDTADPCLGYRMAYDDRCYPTEMVRDVICGCNAKPTKHILGGMECRCSPPVPIHVQQPEEDGKCLIPDLRFPDYRRQFQESPYSSLESKLLNCSADQAHCFSMGKVQVEEGPGCFPLKERGPCPAEHLVVLDGQAALQGRAEGVCAHQRGGCPQGQRRMAFDQRCYHDADLELIRQGQLYLSEFGDTVTTESFQSEKELSFFNRSNHGNNECMIYRKRGWKHGGGHGAVHYPSPRCGSGKGKCTRYEVKSQTPKPSTE